MNYYHCSELARICVSMRESGKSASISGTFRKSTNLGCLKGVLHRRRYRDWFWRLLKRLDVMYWVESWLPKISVWRPLRRLACCHAPKWSSWRSRRVHVAHPTTCFGRATTVRRSSDEYSHVFVERRPRVVGLFVLVCEAC